MRCMVWLLKWKNKGIRNLFDKLRLIPFTPNEQWFPKEHTRKKRYIADALDVLQGEKNGSGYRMAFGYAHQSSLKLRFLDNDDVFVTHSKSNCPFSGTKKPVQIACYNLQLKTFIYFWRKFYSVTFINFVIIQMKLQISQLAVIDI